MSEQGSRSNSIRPRDYPMRTPLLRQSVAEGDGRSIVEPDQVDIGRVCRERFRAHVEDPLLSRRIPSEVSVRGCGNDIFLHSCRNRTADRLDEIETGHQAHSSNRMSGNITYPE